MNKSTCFLKGIAKTNMFKFEKTHIDEPVPYFKKIVLEYLDNEIII